jgi:hypothetical protein
VRSYRIQDGAITEEPVEVPGLAVPGLEPSGAEPSGFEPAGERRGPGGGAL